MKTSIRQQYIYVLHFDEPLAHARHYCGSTENLQARLRAHAMGHGSRLTKELYAQGISWRLGSLGVCSLKAMRKIERTLKNCASTPDYCELCMGEEAKRISYTTPFPLSAIPWASDSMSIQNRMLPHERELLTGTDVTLRYTGEEEDRSVQAFVKACMQTNKDKLGFIPADGEQGLVISARKGWILLAMIGVTFVGYTAFTISRDALQCNVQQCVTVDHLRGLGIGRMMLEKLHADHPNMQMVAKVRTDLAANHFWRACGYTEIVSLRHRTSGSVLNHYVKQPLTLTKENAIVLVQE